MAVVNTHYSISFPGFTLVTKGVASAIVGRAPCKIVQVICLNRLSITDVINLNTYSLSSIGITVSSSLFAGR
jgi:hypothetical protein